MNPGVPTARLGRPICRGAPIGVMDSVNHDHAIETHCHSHFCQVMSTDLAERDYKFEISILGISTILREKTSLWDKSPISGIYPLGNGIYPSF